LAEGKMFLGGFMEQNNRNMHSHSVCVKNGFQKSGLAKIESCLGKYCLFF